MPPTPDRPQKPAVPRRGGKRRPALTAKSVPSKPGAIPVSIPESKLPLSEAPTPILLSTGEVHSPPFQAEPEREWMLRLSPLLWWGMALALGILLIACFEFGYSVGQSRVTRLQAEAKIEVASTKPTVDSMPSSHEVKLPLEAVREPKEPKPTAVVEPSRKSAVPISAPAKKEEPIRAVEPGKPVESSVSIKFDRDILPIFQTKCISCHGGLSKKGGLDLRTLASIARGGNGGPGITAGQPGESPVWQSLKTGQMPPTNKPQLTADEKQLILKWIAGGAR